jgi:hypothetical protein
MDPMTIGRCRCRINAGANQCWRNDEQMKIHIFLMSLSHVFAEEEVGSIGA